MELIIKQNYSSRSLANDNMESVTLSNSICWFMRCQYDSKTQVYHSRVTQQLL